MHEKLGRIWRDIATRYEAEVLHLRHRSNHVAKARLSDENIRQTRRLGGTKRLVKRSLSHVRINDQDALAGLGNDSGKIGRDKCLAGVRTGARDENDIVLGFETSKVQAGPQATYSLDGQVCRIPHCKKMQSAVRLEFSSNRVVLLFMTDRN